MTVIKLSEPVEDIVVNLLRLANTKLPADVGWALEAAAGWETNEVAYTQLGAIMEKRIIVAMMMLNAITTKQQYIAINHQSVLCIENANISSKIERWIIAS